MGAFTLDVSNPLPSGFTQGFGGPGQGGHTGRDWFEAFGNDLGAPAGTPVHSVFDGKVTKVDRTHIDATTGPVYGAGIFVRAVSDVLDPDAPDGAGCYYTHVSLGPGITENALISRGDVVGEIVEVPAIPPHLHFAIAERRGGVNHGIDIFDLLVETAGSADVMTLTLDGTTPQVTPATPDHEPLVEPEN
jgi:murein DD-endopeptidase MepM/ murein hydrolase activator NlpD